MSKAFRVSWWDRLLVGVAPDYGVRRLRARAAAATVERHYEAAGGGRRTTGWRRYGSDANAAAWAALPALRELSRDLRRNNGWARRGVQAITNNTIGWGIRAKAKAENPELAKRALTIWDGWADTSGCDFAGRMPFAGVQKLVMQTVVEAGEALVLFVPAEAADGLTIPLRLRVLEPDHLDTSRDGTTRDGTTLVQGVEFDALGRRVAYYLFPTHPGATRVQGKFESVRVPASEVLHIFNVDRPGQVRGVPWLAAAIAKLNDFDDYEDAVLMQQKVAACFGAFVHDVDGASTPLGQEDATDERLEELSPGQIQYLPPGRDITFATPPAVSDHGSFTATNLRRVAAALGVTYEDMTGDYSQVNFSSARMARLAHWANVHDWRWNMVIPQLCDGVWRRAMGLMGILEGWPEQPGVEWSPPPMPMLEPDKEGMAYSRLVRNGLMSLPAAIRERGEDPEAVLQEIAEANARLDALKIILDSDPRRTTSSGGTQGGGDQVAASDAAAATSPKE